MISQYFFEKNIVLVDYIGIFFLDETADSKATV
jgi:hypothetical protein